MKKLLKLFLKGKSYKFFFFILKWLVSNVSVYCKPWVRLIAVCFLNNKKNQVNVALSERTKYTSN